MANTLKLGAGKWATGTDTVLAFNDLNNNFKPLAFDFSRASSATVVNQSGLIETVGSGTPRIDFLGNTKGALLLEPSRTNLFTYSEDFSQSYWNKNSASVTLTSKIAPNGTLNSVYNLVGTAANLWSAGTIGTQHTISFYIKSNGQGKDKFRLRLGNNTSIEYTATNEWVRYEYAETPTTSVYSITTSSAPNDEYDLLVWGGQSEVGSYATSYIPTSGQSGGVTRVGDTCNQTPPSGVIGQTEGTVYIDFNYLNSTGERRFIFQLGTGNTTIYARIESGQSLTSQIINSGSGLTSTGTNVPSGINKLAIAYANNDCVIYFNGLQIAISTSITTPLVDQLFVGHNSNGQQTIAGLINNTKLYNTRLSNAELQALTTI